MAEFDRKKALKILPTAIVFKHNDEGDYAPSNELCYGPWPSLDAAWNHICDVFEVNDDPSNAQYIPIGLTVGIVDPSTDVITEYWLSGGHTKANLVKKTGVNEDQKATVEVTDYTKATAKALPKNASYVINGLPAQSRSITVLNSDFGDGAGNVDVLVFFDSKSGSVGTTDGTYYVFTTSNMRYKRTFTETDVPSDIFDAFWSENTSVNGSFLKIEIGGKTYIIPNASEAVIPATPVINTSEQDFVGYGNVEISCATSGATIYYSINGGSYTAYSGAIALYQDDSLQKKTYEIVAKASKNGETGSECLKKTFGVKRKLESPTINSSPSSNYDTTSTITITSADGADIYYTTDGSTPSASKSKYTSAFTINSTKTIKAIAIKSDWENSDVSELSKTLGTPKVYYGKSSSNTSISLSNLTGVGKSASGLKTTYKVTTDASNPYIWFCIPNGIYPDEGLLFRNEINMTYDGMENPVDGVVSGYTCFCSDSLTAREYIITISNK